MMEQGSPDNIAPLTEPGLERTQEISSVYETLPSLENFDTEAWFATSDHFDTSEDKWLEVKVSWEGSVLDIGHYHTPRRLTFGSDPRADFCYAIDNTMLNPGQAAFFPLIEAAKGGFLLCFDTDMEGVVEQNGERNSLLDLVNAGRAHYFHLSRTGRCYYPLVPGSCVQLFCHGLEITIRFVPAPKFHRSFIKRLDNSYAPVLSLSVITHLVMAVFAMMGPSSDEKSDSGAKSVQRVAQTPGEDRLPSQTPEEQALADRIRSSLLYPSWRTWCDPQASEQGPPRPSPVSTKESCSPLHPAQHRPASKAQQCERRRPKALEARTRTRCSSHQAKRGCTPHLQTTPKATRCSTSLSTRRRTSPGPAR